MRIISNKVDEYIRNNTVKHGKSTNLALFRSEKFDRIFHKIRYLMTLYSNTLDPYSYNKKVKINSDDNLSSEKTTNT